MIEPKEQAYHYICAWCEAVIGLSDTGEDSHGVCLDCLPGIFQVPIEAVDKLATEEIDDLPYGLIRLDQNDHVIAFNRFEEEVAHLRREDVLGRSFFHEVAPCTNVKELAGWIHDARERGETASTQVMFVFDFTHGRRLVTIALTYNKVSRCATLLVRAETGGEV